MSECLNCAAHRGKIRALTDEIDRLEAKLAVSEMRRQNAEVLYSEALGQVELVRRAVT